jgi:hypothetical protein
MKRILALAAMAATTLLIFNSSASAQGYYNGGYEFGAGINASRYYGGRNPFNDGRFLGFNRFGLARQQLDRRFDRPSDLPYFAKFPPVYYSHIVKRPYGVSPFAAPSGITPVEMTVPAPIDIQNPYFGQPIEVDEIEVPAPAADEAETETTEEEVEIEDAKTTWKMNPYYLGGAETSFAGK